MNRKRLVLMVEGQGDMEAAPVLVDRLLKEYHAAESVFDILYLDRVPFRVGEYSKIRGKEKQQGVHDFGEWQRFLKAALTTRKNVGGCILLLDGDSTIKMEGKPFCAAQAARLLTAEAKKVGAGSTFSLAVVFACMEFESWLIAGIDSLLGKTFEDGRRVIPESLSKDLKAPNNPEKKRDAKGWFRQILKGGYKPTRDQAELTKIVDLNLIRGRNEMRSFRRMESAIKAMIDAIRSGSHVVSPT
jgi:hypothetical protein